MGTGQAVTLANSIIGVGILAMPFCFQQCGIVLSLLLLLISGLMSRLASHFLLKSAIKTRRRNFEILAFHVFGNPGKLFVEMGIIGFLMGSCIAYFVVVGDLGPQIVAKLFNINQSSILRTAVMIIVSVVCVLPLGLLKDVGSLSNVCAVTMGFYFCLVLKVVAEAEIHIFRGDWVSKVKYWQPGGILRCLPIFSMSLFCQTQLFEIYETLSNASLERMNIITKNAVTICSVVYALVGLFGYIAFCDETISGNILSNFSPSMVSDAVKMGFVMSLAFSFPLIIFPCRASLYSLLYKKAQVSPHDILSNMMPDFRFRWLTVSIITVSLIVGLMLPNIEIVLGLIGSTIGVIICVILPATCFIYITIKNTSERMLAQLVLGLGIIIMVLGTYANLQAAEIDNINLMHKYNQNNMLKHDLYIKEESAILDETKEDKNAIILNEKMNVIKVDKLNVDKIDSLKISPDSQRKTIKKSVKDDLPLENSNLLNRIVKEGAGDHEVQKNNVDFPIPKVLKENKSIKTAENDIESTDLQEKKKNDLIDTIKRHEEEQRQIMNEQMEILKEMKKTKKEIEKDTLLKKIEVNVPPNMDERKLAVENIQKLAKIAIESLGNLDTLSEKKISIDKLMDSSPIPKVNNFKGKTTVKTLPDAELKVEKEQFVKKNPEYDNKNQTHLVGDIDKVHLQRVFTKINPNIVPTVKYIDDKSIKLKPATDKTSVVNDALEGAKRDILEVRTVSATSKRIVDKSHKLNVSSTLIKGDNYL